MGTIMQISRDWRAGLSEFATIGWDTEACEWTVTHGRTASGRDMERTDEPMIVDGVERFATSGDAQAFVTAGGYR